MAAASPIPMPETPSWRRFEIAIIGTARRLNTAFNDRVEPLDLNLNQASLLAFVVDFGDSTQTALAEMVGLGRAATGTMIDHLEARGLLERRPDPSDRRVWLVAATDAGRDIVEQFYEIDRALRDELRRGIGRTDRQWLAELLERLDANIDLAIENSPKNSPQK
jgi:MarR family transcriptional regulator, transcriptional regulator for hemolysin